MRRHMAVMGSSMLLLSSPSYNSREADRLKGGAVSQHCPQEGMISLQTSVAVVMCGVLH